jgi:hypothetical protein
MAMPAGFCPTLIGVPTARVARLSGVTVPVIRSLVMYAVVPSGVIAIPRPPGPFPILMGRPARCVAVLTGVTVPGPKLVT